MFHTLATFDCGKALKDKGLVSAGAENVVTGIHGILLVLTLISVD
jgi:hypothetical protein